MDTGRIVSDLPCVRRIRLGNPDRVAWYRLVVGERSAIRRPRRVCARNQQMCVPPKTDCTIVVICPSG